MPTARLLLEVRHQQAAAGTQHAPGLLHALAPDGARQVVEHQGAEHHVETVFGQLPRSANVVERLLGFDVLVLDHIEAQLAALSKGRQHGQPQIHRRLAQVLVQRVEADLRRSQPRPAPDVPVALLANFLVTTFLEVVNCWLHVPDRPPAREAHGLYRALVEPALRR